MPLRQPFVALVIFSLMVSAGGAVRADVTMPPFFSDHMVLQRDGIAPIWGTAEPGENVTVRFRDQEQQATADAQGNWRVELKGLKAGGPDELTITGKNTITLTDVLVGEVWVGSGQSNMGGSVGLYYKNDPALEQMMSTAYPQIRGCTARGGWKVATPQNSGMPRRSWTGNATFSALLFSMAVRLHEELNVPVGMMLGAVGGTPSGAWLSPETLAADKPSQKQMAAYAEAYPAALKEYEDRLARYEQEEAKRKAEGKTMARGPSAPYPPGTVHGKPIGHLYALHIKPFVGYGIRGVLWDQGEAGTRVGGVDQYTMMGALIRGWRNAWNVGEFPFIYVQKPSGHGCSWDSPTAAPGTPIGQPRANVIQPFTPLPNRVPGGGGGLNGFDNYVKMMTYPNVGMVISTDLVAGIHPIIKSAYGDRAAKVALGIVYGKPVEYYGPVYASHTIDGNVVRVTFTHVGNGLTMRHSEKLQGFAVAGDDKVFQWAEAKIDGDTVVLSSPDVARPTAVRYAWGWYTPWANLFNQDGLPAVAFRTDAW